MAEPPKITDLHQIIQPHLGDSQIVSYSSRYLTKPGDNYGSLMLSITLNVKRPNGDSEELPLIAKLPPLTNEMFWSIFQPERTCLTENATYQYLAPELEKLQLEAGINELDLFDGFTKYYGSRISLDPNAAVVDRDAVLVLENLQTAGYKAGNRHKMYDLEHTKFIMREMAKYHALPIALRLKKPELFDKKVRPFFKHFDITANMSEQELADFDNEGFKEVQLATNNNEEVLNSAKRIAKLYNSYLQLSEVPDTPYTSLVHCDLWINNMMFKYDEAGHPVHLKIVDFQVAQSEHIAHDIIFFLFSSVENDVLEQNYYELLEIYYKAFIECLESVGVPTTSYDYKTFLNEVHRVAPMEIWHAICMTKVLLADNSTLPDDFKDLGMDTFSKNLGGSEITKRTLQILNLAKKLKILE